MVQIYIVYTALPTVIARSFQEKGIGFDIYSVKGITYAYFIFSFGMIAVMSEMFRGSLSAIDKGQLEAAKSIGLSTLQGYRRDSDATGHSVQPACAVHQCDGPREDELSGLCDVGVRDHCHSQDPGCEVHVLRGGISDHRGRCA